MVGHLDSGALIIEKLENSRKPKEEKRKLVFFVPLFDELMYVSSRHLMGIHQGINAIVDM